MADRAGSLSPPIRASVPGSPPSTFRQYLRRSHGGHTRWLLTLGSVLLFVLSGATAASAVSSTAPSAPVAGDWHGTIEVGVQRIGIAVHLGAAAQGLAGTIDIPQQGVRGLPLANVGFTPPRLVFDFPAGQTTAHFDGTLEGDRISGAFSQGPARGTFALERGPAEQPAAPPAEGTPIRLVTSTGTLFGTLDLPAGNPPFPVVLLVAGSGPTDRNGNSPLLAGRNDSLLLLARTLREAGIASVRSDKRGVGESAAALSSESTITFGTYIDDAVAWLRMLEADPRFSRIGVIGHSEGSLIGMEAARIAGVDAFVSLEGVGEPAALLLKRQLAQQPEAIRDRAYAIIDSLGAGREVADVPADLQALFRPSVQPYLISWFRYDPRKVIAELRVPVLIVQGTTDLQVSMDDARMLHDALPGSRLAIIDGMNHVLKLAPAERDKNLAAYANPDLPLAPDLVTALVGFLRGALG
jgi:pimeloyl-ACP methyl ester carboxylesterase